MASDSGEDRNEKVVSQPSKPMARLFWTLVKFPVLARKHKWGKHKMPENLSVALAVLLSGGSETRRAMIELGLFQRAAKEIRRSVLMGAFVPDGKEKPKYCHVNSLLPRSRFRHAKCS